MKRILAGLIGGMIFGLMISEAAMASGHEDERYEHGGYGYYGDSDDRYEYGHGRSAVSAYPYGNYEYRAIVGRPYYSDDSYYGSGRYYEGHERYEHGGYGYDDDRYERRGWHHD